MEVIDTISDYFPLACPHRDTNEAGVTITRVGSSNFPLLSVENEEDRVNCDDIRIVLAWCTRSPTAELNIMAIGQAPLLDCMQITDQDKKRCQQ